LVASNLSLAPPPGVELVAAPTAEDVEREVLLRADADIVLMAAAVADYRPAARVAGKRGKDRDVWTVELEPTPDVLRTLAGRAEHGLLVGFAAESGEHAIERARGKLTDKNVNLIVFNDVSRNDVGFEVEENEVVLVSRDGERRIEKTTKREVAEAILDEVVQLSG
jgi:phosphopantothenoylcysteine decarboxylase / phosphopantothenate---cysteine ligase